MKAIVDQDKCIGCTLCTQISPEVFRMEGDKAIAYTNPIPDGLIDACKDAASQCPVEAITVA
ncbi:MAG: ferredoxin [Candidatus Omnitrophota bacterium]|nr:ferredoxin [Candidatus Omnitrophota bacterium]